MAQPAPAETNTLVIPKVSQPETLVEAQPAPQVAPAPVAEVTSQVTQTPPTAAAGTVEATPQAVNEAVPTLTPTEEVDEKFDDSFVVANPVEEVPTQQVDPNSSTSIEEIAQVNLNSQGMLQEDAVPKTDSGEPLLELVDDDDDDINDLDGDE